MINPFVSLQNTTWLSSSFYLLQDTALSLWFLVFCACPFSSSRRNVGTLMLFLLTHCFLGDITPFGVYYHHILVHPSSETSLLICVSRNLFIQHLYLDIVLGLYLMTLGFKSTLCTVAHWYLCWDSEHFISQTPLPVTSTEIVSGEVRESER